jgi:superfamily II DNA helicase RecQ
VQLRFFAVPVLGGEEAAEELNRFLAGHRILAVDRHLAQHGLTSVWAVCVSYEPAGNSRPSGGRRGKLDYREVLSEADFTIYARLRSLRKEIADAEGVPLYALFTNEQMAEMVTRRVSSVSDLREIAGVGEARVEKYGDRFLEALAQSLGEVPPSTAAPDEA